MDTGFAGDASFIARPGGAALSFRSSLTGTRTLFFGVAILDQTGVDDVLGQRAGRRELDLLDLKPSMLGAFFFMLHNVLFVIHFALRHSRCARVVTPLWTRTSRRPGPTTKPSATGPLYMCGLAR